MTKRDKREGAEAALSLQEAINQYNHAPDIVPQHLAAKECGISRNLVGVWIKRGKLATIPAYGERWVSIAAVKQVKSARKG